MKIFKTKAELRQWRETVSNQSVGLVPTMGALHAGHLSLVKKSQKECKHTVVSIFINKLQFGPNEDFNNYPRFIEQDVNCLKNKNVDVLFCPKQAEIYSDDLSFQINEMTIAKKLEGKHDFSTFRASSCSAKSPVRTLNKVHVTQSKNKIKFKFKSR